VEEPANSECRFCLSVEIGNGRAERDGHRCRHAPHFPDSPVTANQWSARKMAVEGQRGRNIGLVKDEARPLAVDIAKLPEQLGPRAIGS
jgi:hypothetical protein